MKEEWRDIKSVDSQYEISNFGNVRNARSWEKITPYKQDNGYLRVTFYQRLANGLVKKSSAYVHLLVARAFMKLGSGCVGWLDNNVENNALSNLFLWPTPTRSLQKKSLWVDSGNGLALDAQPVLKISIKIGGLKCNKLFQQAHKNNRICGSCKISDEWRAYHA